MTKADDIARDVEGWLDKKYYKQVNALFGGIRQMWNDGKANQQAIREQARKLKMEELVAKVCTAKN